MVKELKIEEDQPDPSRQVTRMKRPYMTASQEDWQGFKEFYENNRDALFHHLTIHGDTPFHIAASRGTCIVLQDLLQMVPESRIRDALTLPDDHGNTALHEVATTDNVEAADLMIRKLDASVKAAKGMEEEENTPQLEQLLKVRNKLGETPLYRAAALGRKKMVLYLAEKIEKLSGNIRAHLYRYDTISILHIAVLGQHFDVALWLLKKHDELGKEKEIKGLTCLHLIALMPSAFESTSSMSILKKIIYFCLPSPGCEDDEPRAQSIEGEDLETGFIRGGCDQPKKRSAISRMYSAFWRCLMEGSPMIKGVWAQKGKHESALKLVKALVKQDISWKDCCKVDDEKTVYLGLDKGGKKPSMGSSEAATSEKSSSSPETPLLLAARSGILEIVNEILDEYPQAVDHVSDRGLNVLDVAIMHRQREIFKRIKTMKMSFKKLASKFDHNRNSILHHVADISHYGGGTAAGPALQLKDELAWFKRVEKALPPHYLMHRNKDRITAQDLFEEQHRKQLEEAQKWIKETAESCSTVAVLVATVVFAAAYTVPGDFNEEGLPNFLHSPLFLLFTVMDVVSLASSLTAVVMFLSILTSSLELEDFFLDLPRKLTVGFAFLFFSVMTTMITFTASLLLVLHLKRKLTSFLIYTAAFIPVAVFAIMQLPLYVKFLDIFREFFKEIKKALPLPVRKKRN